MKKIAGIYIIALLFCLCSSNTHAQYPSVISKIYGASPFQDSLWVYDTTTYNILMGVMPSIPGPYITGIMSMAYDPTTYKTYIVAKLFGVSGRILGTIDLNTFAVTQVGNLGDKFSSIIFDRNGQLYGATGNGAVVSEGFYSIDKLTAATTLLYIMGNGDDGEVINYNRFDEHIYHWSGNGTIVFEKWPISNLTYAPVNIPTSGVSGGETFGALFVDSTKFMVSNINSKMKYLTTTGSYGNDVISCPDDNRGLVMPPQFAISEDTLCQNVDTLYIAAVSLQEFDSVVYHWGDGTSTTVGVTGAFHIYTAPGDYIVEIELDNGVVRDTTFEQFAIHINNTPVVSLSGSSTLCPGQTVTLNGTSGGTSQWYLNGVPIIGETTPSLTVSSAGVYNMVKTNLNGCADSSQISLVLIDVPNPTVNLGNDTTVCGSIQLDAGNAGGSFIWSTGGISQTETISVSASISVEVTDTNSCVSSDTIVISINPLPIVLISISGTGDSILCPGETVILLGSSGGTSQWYLNGSPIIGETSTSLVASVAGVYNMLKTNSNGCSDSSQTYIELVEVPDPIVSIITSDSIVCVDASVSVLVGNPAGGIYSGTSVIADQFDPSIGVGVYDLTYTYTDGNNCTSADTLTIEVEDCAGITENHAINLKVYPNPSTGQFTIENDFEITSIELVDMAGKVVWSTETLTNNKTILNVGSQPDGNYSLNIFTGEVNVAKVKIMIVQE